MKKCLRETFFLVSLKKHLKLFIVENKEKQTIESLNKGDYFKKKENSKKTFERGSYCRTNKAYECTNIDDIGDFIYVKKGKLILISDD